MEKSKISLKENKTIQGTVSENIKQDNDNKKNV